ncbi:MAG: TatD family hydrolase [Patescibacteria group bacterium]
MPKLIDTHSHLHFKPYDQDRADVLNRMKENDVRTITVGTAVETSRSAIELAESSDLVWAAVGYHPDHCTSSHVDEDEGEVHDFSLKQIETLAHSSKRVVAIGEIGLDFHHIDKEWNLDDAKEAQKKVFIEQLQLANDMNLPVIIHCRDAYEELAQVIQDRATAGFKVRGVMHCFGQSWDVAKIFLDLGLHLSFTGTITFKPRAKDDPAKHVHRVIEMMPEERLMIETDAPWLAPDPFRGKRNEPIYVEHIAKKVAELRGMTFEQVAKLTTKNAEEFFRI